jgi:hypothetical protein
MLSRETIDAIIGAGLGDDDTAEVVDASNNSGSFHIYKSPLFVNGCIYILRKQRLIIPERGAFVKKP